MLLYHCIINDNLSGKLQYDELEFHAFRKIRDFDVFYVFPDLLPLLRTLYSISDEVIKIDLDDIGSYRWRLDHFSEAYCLRLWERHVFTFLLDYLERMSVSAMLTSWNIQHCLLIYDGYEDNTYMERRRFRKQMSPTDTSLRSQLGEYCSCS